MTTMADKMKDRTIRRLKKEKGIIKATIFDQAADPFRVAAVELILTIRELFGMGYNGPEILELTKVVSVEVERYQKKKKAEVKKLLHVALEHAKTVPTKNKKKGDIQ